MSPESVALLFNIKRPQQIDTLKTEKRLQHCTVGIYQIECSGINFYYLSKKHSLIETWQFVLSTKDKGFSYRPVYKECGIVPD